MNTSPNIDDYQTQLYTTIRHMADVCQEGLDELFAIAGVKDADKGTKLLPEGKACRHIWFVAKGYLRTFINNDGIEVTTSFAFENSFITDLKSLRTGEPAATNIQAGEDTILYTFDKDALFGLYKDRPEIESFGRRLVEQLLMRQEEQANLFRLFTPTARYKHLLATEPHIVQRVPLAHLASYLGMARETLSRTRKIK